MILLPSTNLPLPSLVTDGEGTLLSLAAQPLMGSSHTSGGILHGHACGNISNHADFTTTNFELDILSRVKFTFI